MKTAQKRNKRK